MGLLFLRMLQKFGLDRAILQSGRCVVMTLVAQYTNQFSRQCVIEQCDDFMAVGLISGRHCAIIKVFRGSSNSGGIDAGAWLIFYFMHDFLSVIGAIGEVVEMFEYCLLNRTYLSSRMSCRPLIECDIAIDD